MPEAKNLFTGGRMNKDLDSRLLPKGEYRDALNFKVANSSSSDVGALENELSNRKLTNISFVGVSPICIGMLADTFNNKIYWWVVSDSASYLLEHDEESAITTIVLEDTRTSGNNILNLNKDFLITGANILIDSDTGISLLFWTDNTNPPRGINVDRAKGYLTNGFDDADISVIKAPPLNPPTIVLQTATDEENNIEERFLRFAYRYKYLDGEYSTLSSFTETAFLPNTFLFDFSTSSNESMVNAFNSVDVGFNTGSNIVVSVDLLFKESGSSTVFVVGSFNKDDEGWADNTNQLHTFNNNKIFRALDEFQLGRLFDVVPFKSKGQEIIANRLTYGNSTFDINIVDCNSVRIPIKYSLSAVYTSIVEGTPTRSLKSNRDYEIGIVYITDDFGRMTTVLTSTDNTIYFKNKDCLTQNQIKVTLENKAPCNTKKYRFFIKQTKVDYDTLVPVLFFTENTFTWIKLEGEETNKITVGDFLNVKSDTEGIINGVVQTKVLEIRNQDRNFLEEETVTEIKQPAGVYFKVKPSGFTLNSEDIETYEFISNTRDDVDAIVIEDATANVVEKAVYYGTVDDFNDLTSSGTYTGITDIRYIVKMFSIGTPDTFQWSNDDGATFDNNGGLGFSITGATQILENGVQVIFGATTGHALDDEWVVSAKSFEDDNLGQSEEQKAYAHFKSLPSNGNINQDDKILGGAVITIIYDETNNQTHKVEKLFVSSTIYDNLEEWFFKEDIISDLSPISINDVWFRRGVLKGTQHPDDRVFIQDPTGDMVMIIRSIGRRGKFLGIKEKTVRIASTLRIKQNPQNVIFETKPLNDDSQNFFEIGRTYDIDSNGNHLGFDGNDISQTAVVDAELILPTFNCYSWGNCFESYKIKDVFNAQSFKIDTRPSNTIEDYRENVRIASLTYSQPYNQSTNFNGLNEFNLSRANFKDMDDEYGSIQKIYSKDTNLIVFQEDKLHNVPFQKDILFDADGNGNIRESSNVLGTERGYAGEFGISKEPESFAVYGNSIYFTDTRRGHILRLAGDGITVISDNGMRDFIRDLFEGATQTKKLGGYDLFNNQYVLHLDDVGISKLGNVVCGSNIEIEELVSTTEFNLVTLASNTDIIFNHVIGAGQITIGVTENEVLTTSGTLTGTGVFAYTRADNGVTTLKVTITAISTTPSFSISMPCPVIAVDDTVTINKGDVLDINVLGNDTFVSPVTVTVTVPPTKGGAVVQIDKTIRYTHGDADFIDDVFTYKIDDGDTSDTADVTVIVSDLVIAVDDNVAITEGEVKNINVLANDTFIDPVTVTITQQPNEGTVFVETDKTITYTHNNSNVLPDTFIYEIDDGNTTDTANVNITVTAIPTGIGIIVSPVGSNTAAIACTVLPSTTKYHNGAASLPVVSDTIYNDFELITVFNGGSLWYNISGSLSVQIESLGIVININDCVGTSGNAVIMRTAGFSTASEACGSSGGQITRYHDGAGTLPVLGDFVFTDSGLTTPFDGLSLWYFINNSLAVFINASGEITDTDNCGS